MSKPRGIFLGRFQPPHNGHEHLMRQKLDQGIPLLILVRNTPKNDKNPYDAFEIKKLWELVFENDDVIIEVIPDSTWFFYGRTPGFKVEEVIAPNTIKAISATDIRNKVESDDDSWKELVHPKTAVWLENYYKDK